MSADKVVKLATANKDRQPPLSDAELVKIRAMLAEFEAIKHSCPVARRATGGDG